MDRNAEMRNFDNLIQYFGLIAFFDDGQCLDKNEIILKIVIQDSGIDLIQSLEIPKQLIQGDKLKELLVPSQTAEIFQTIVDKLVVNETFIEYEAPKS